MKCKGCGNNYLKGELWNKLGDIILDGFYCEACHEELMNDEG